MKGGDQAGPTLSPGHATSWLVLPPLWPSVSTSADWAYARLPLSLVEGGEVRQEFPVLAF